MVEALRVFSDTVTVFDEKFAGRGGWKKSFPVSGPLYVELGTGKGQFLRDMAQNHPEACFIGLEKEPGILVQAVRKARELGLTNLKFVLGDVQFLAQLFSPAEIDGLYIHFCDPWPKSRHGRRRLTHENFLRLYRQTLTSAGVIRFKTDNRELFDYSLDSFSSFGMDLLTVSYDFHAGTPDSSCIMTEYEAKFSAAGLPVHYCEARFGGLPGEATDNG
jgi:tRNA (guanine-N7-)-methyltransferase